MKRSWIIAFLAGLLQLLVWASPSYANMNTTAVGEHSGRNETTIIETMSDDDIASLPVRIRFTVAPRSGHGDRISPSSRGHRIGSISRFGDMQSRAASSPRGAFPRYTVLLI